MLVQTLIKKIALLVVGVAGDLGDLDVPVAAERSGKGEADRRRVGRQRADVEVD